MEEVKTEIKLEAKPELDLITKVTNYKKQETPKEPTDLVDINFDFKELENIKDPLAKDVAMKAYKSMQSGATKKFQEASTLRKEAEEKVKAIEQKMAEMSTWTPDRIQKELLNNPGFLEAAQQIAGNQNTESLLSEEDRAKINSLENELKMLKQTNNHSIIAQEDVLLQGKYADYNPIKVDDALAQLAKMPPHKLREYVYKAMFHDEHVKSAYDLALQENKQQTQEKINAISMPGDNVNVNTGVSPKEKSETDVQYFVRLAQANKARLQK